MVPRIAADRPRPRSARSPFPWRSGAARRIAVKPGLDGADVLQGQVVGDAAEGHGAGGLDLARDDDEQIAAQGRELVDDVASGALAERGQRDHRRDSHRQAGHREGGAQPVADQGLGGESEDVDGSHPLITLRPSSIRNMRLGPLGHRPVMGHHHQGQALARSSPRAAP